MLILTVTRQRGCLPQTIDAVGVVRPFRDGEQAASRTESDFPSKQKADSNLERNQPPPPLVVVLLARGHDVIGHPSTNGAGRIKPVDDGWMRLSLV